MPKHIKLPAAPAIAGAPQTSLELPRNLSFAELLLSQLGRGRKVEPVKPCEKPEK